VAVASAGPYASLHLAPDRQPRQYPTTLFFLQAGCSSCHPTNSVKALKAQGRDKQLGDKQGPDLHNILRQSDNDKVTINLRRTSNLQNILQ